LAAGTVTGSKYLVSGGKAAAGGLRIISGLKELRLRNWNALLKNRCHLTGALLTHAHLTIPVICRDLCATVFAARFTLTRLPSSCAICCYRLRSFAGGNSDNAARRGSVNNPPLPLYTQADVEPVLNAFR